MGDRGPQSSGVQSESAGFVLAGGQSTRMGRDKALLSFGDRPLIVHAVSILRNVGLTVQIAGARSDLSEFAPVVQDSEAGLGPLAGVCSALASTAVRYVVFLPIDLPLLPPSLIAYMLGHAAITGQAVTLASAGGFVETFPAVLDRGVLPALQASLDAGRAGCFAAFQAAASGLGQPLHPLPVEVLAQSAHVSHPRGLPADCWFLNVNTEADLKRAEALSGVAIA